MSPANSPTSSGLLSDRGPLDACEAVDVWGQLLGQVAALHGAGHLNGRITLQSVFLSSSGEAQLAPSPNQIVLENSELFELCPPELEAHSALTLPADIIAATDRLTEAGMDCDPRRIDIFQLGAVLCRMLSGEGVPAYLQSPKIRGKVPAALREIVDRSIGYEAQRRFTQVRELQAALNQVDVSSLAASSPASRAASAKAEKFDRLGPYKILARLGGGGMGEVYHAHDESLDRDVAIKVLPPELARHDDFVRRFRAEAMAVAKLVHPSIVQIYTFSEDAGQRYFAMQYVDGESLAACLKRRRLSIEEVLTIVEQCLAGLAAAHAKGLIHRDVKPGNILLDQKHHRALLADFGLVKALNDGASLTSTGEVLGTLDYLSPEQAHGQAVDGRADLYSLGVVMFQMLAGRLPFEAESPTTMIFKHAFEQPPALADLAPEVPRRVDAIVTRLMAKNSANRYQTAEEVLSDIRAYRAGKPAHKAEFAAVADSAANPAIPIDAGLEPREGWRRRIFNVFSRHAPQLAEKLQNTQQQVDGAVRQYQARHDQLAALVRDAEDVTRELAAQIEGHKESAREAAQKAASASDVAAAAQFRRQQAECERATVDFEKQLAEQRARNQELQSQLSQAAGTLQQLRSRRDVLNARLETAMAEIRTDGGGGNTRSSMKFWIGAAAILLAAIAGIWGLRIVRTGTAEKPTAARPEQSVSAAAINPLSLPGLNAKRPAYSSELAGSWRLQLPVGPEQEVELLYVDKDHYRLQGQSVFSGVYRLRGDRLEMQTPDDPRQNELKPSYQWLLDSDKLLELVGQPPAEKYGNHFRWGRLVRGSEPVVFPPESMVAPNPGWTRKVAPLQLGGLKNASDPSVPENAYPASQPFHGDLSGRWEMTLPAGFVWEVEITRAADDRYKLKNSKGLTSVGEYVVHGNRLVMEEPNETRLKELWPFQWQIDDDRHMVLIGQPQVGQVGGTYLGAKMEKQ